MSEPDTLLHIDDTARERVRRALRRYMAESRIGVPSLQALIIKADAPRRREIPLSTLQRFLAGRHRTSDHHVVLCHKFVKDLPYYGEGKDLAAFGAAALTLFAPPLYASEGRNAPPIIASYLAGRYRTSRYMSDFKEDLSYEEEFPHPPLPGRFESEISLTAAAEGLWLDVRETVVEPAVIEAQGNDPNPTRDRRFLFEGIAVCVPPQIHIFLRDALTRQPKLYTLGGPDGGNAGTVLEGYGYDAKLRPGPPKYWTDYFRVQAVRLRDGGRIS